MRRTTCWLIALGIILLALLVAGDTRATRSAPALPQAESWTIQCVDCPKAFYEMTDRSLALDADGHPHIAYGQDRLYYAYHDGSGWQAQTVDDSPGVGSHASLALDGAGHPWRGV